MKLETKLSYSDIILRREKDLNLAFTAALVALSLFPIFNYIRMITSVGIDRSVWVIEYSGQVVFDFYYQFLSFGIWRDYCFIIIPFFIALILFFWFKDIFHRPFLTRVKEGLRNNIAFIFLILFALWMTAMTFVNGADYASLIGNEKANVGLICNLCYIGYFVSAIFYKNEKYRRFWVWSLIFSSSVINFLIILDRYFLGLAVHVADGNMVFYNSNDLSAWQMMAALASFTVFVLDGEKKAKLFAGISLCMSVVGLVFSNTLGAVVAFIIAVVFLGIVMKLTGRQNIYYFTAIILAVLAFVAVFFIPCAGTSVREMVGKNLGALHDATDSLSDLNNADSSIGSGRYALWGAAIDGIVKRPVFGWGILKSSMLLFAATGNGTVHNEYLDYAMTYGIPALLLYLAFMLSVFIRGAKHRKELTDFNIMGLVVAFGYLVGAFFSYTIFYTTPFMCIFLGFGYYKKSSGNGEE